MNTKLSLSLLGIVALRKFLTMLLMSVIFSFSIVAQEQTPANSNNLNKNQKRTIAYAKRLLNRLDGKIALPLEINTFIGDTVTKEQYKAVPVWEKAYFLEVDGFSAALVLPINTKTPNGEINSLLNVYNNDDSQYYRFVETMINPSVSTDNIDCYIISNINGILLQNIVSVNGSIVEVQNGIVGYTGVIDKKSTASNYDKKAIDRAIYSASEAGKFSIFKSHSNGLNWIKASSGPFNFTNNGYRSRGN